MTHVAQLLEPLYVGRHLHHGGVPHLVHDARLRPGAAGWPGRCRSSAWSIVIRILLIPLFVKQIKRQRGMQELQPKIKELQAKYKGKTDESRQKQHQR